MQAGRPWSQACENNKAPILQVLRDYFTTAGTILEIGSGTGQHAVHFARHLPHLNWQPTDRAENLPGIALWTKPSGLPNLLSPLCLDVTVQPWPIPHAAGVFSANTAHIMGWDGVEAMFSGAARVLDRQARFCLYGPFMIDGAHTADSNARFDAMLRARDPASGIHDLKVLEDLAKTCGLRLIEDRPMPANNRTLVWERK